MYRRLDPRCVLGLCTHCRTTYLVLQGYQEDIKTAFGAVPALNETERGELYAELASGAESGYDYSSRWCRQPLLNLTDNYPALRTLNTRAIMPVDLNSLLYGDHVLVSGQNPKYSLRLTLLSAGQPVRALRQFDQLDVGQRHGKQLHRPRRVPPPDRCRFQGGHSRPILG